MRDVLIRALAASDLAAADRLRARAGWNQLIPDWERLLALAPEGSFAAERAGEVVGTATTTPSDDAKSAWIGMVLVHPDHRRQGIGRALLEHALGHLEASAAGVIELDASAEGRPLYASLGFESEWPLSRWEGRAAGAAAEVPGAAAAAAAAAEVPGAATVATVPGATPSPARGLHPPARADWDDISLLDEEVLGTRRRRLLEAVSRASYATLVLESAGDLLGYGMIRPGAHADYLGPVIARTREAARVLVAALLQRAEKSAVFWDFPDRNAAAAAMAGALGFRVQRSLTRMRRGEPARPSQPLSIFGITDLATG